MDTLGNRIAGLHRQLEHFDLQSETLLSAMAGIYVDVISPLGPRIQVTGSLPCCKPAGAGESSLSAAGGYSRRGALASGGRRTSAAYVFP